MLEKIRKVAQDDAPIDIEPDPTPGVVPRDHFDRWHIGSFIVDKDLAFADLEHIESLAFIRAKLGQFARDIGVREITIATLMGCNLTFTQRVSQLAYWARANFSGVFQSSVYGRISASDEREGNWAIFERFGENRIRFINPRSTRVVLTDRDLNHALKFLRLRLADETLIERWIRTSQGFPSRLGSR